MGDIYWIFRLATILEFDVGMKDGNVLLCHDISEQIRETEISMRDYNDMMVYDCLKTPL